MSVESLEPGERVIVSGEGGVERPATFLRPGDATEAVVADHQDVQRSLHQREAAIVRFDDGAIRAVSYRDLRLA